MGRVLVVNTPPACSSSEGAPGGALGLAANCPSDRSVLWSHCSASCPADTPARWSPTTSQGLTLVHVSAQREHVCGIRRLESACQ